MISNRKKNISIIGAGNAGCITAMYYYLHAKNDVDKITIYHNPSVNIEKTGQGTSTSVSFLINNFFNLDFQNNNTLKSTRKEGIMYENWGKCNDKVFHPFAQSLTAIHYVPNLLSQKVLESGVFEVIEKDVENAEEEIDSDFIFDCRGRNNREKDLYDDIINPLNSVILAREDRVDKELLYTRTVATPNGWTFVIPNIDSISYGYLYNNTITTKEEATNDFVERFNVSPSEYITFENYIAKSCFYGERTILNGNRLGFIEPLEATSTGFYENVAHTIHGYILGRENKDNCNERIRSNIIEDQNFILWHYQYGSKYDTLFWKYAKSLPFNPNDHFKTVLDYSIKTSYENIIRERIRDRSSISNKAFYSHWPATAFKIWAEGMGLDKPLKCH